MGMGVIYQDEGEPSKETSSFPTPPLIPPLDGLRRGRIYRLFKLGKRFGVSRAALHRSVQLLDRSAGSLNVTGVAEEIYLLASLSIGSKYEDGDFVGFKEVFKELGIQHGYSPRDLTAMEVLLLRSVDWNVAPAKEGEGLFYEEIVSHGSKIDRRPRRGHRRRRGPVDWRLVLALCDLLVWVYGDPASWEVSRRRRLMRNMFRGKRLGGDRLLCLLRDRLGGGVKTKKAGASLRRMVKSCPSVKRYLPFLEMEIEPWKVKENGILDRKRGKPEKGWNAGFSPTTKKKSRSSEDSNRN